jgi:Glycosyl transferase family 2/Glycosyltransferase family 87
MPRLSVLRARIPWQAIRVTGAVFAAVTLAGLVLAFVRPAIRHRLGVTDLAILAALWITFAAGALLVRRMPLRLAMVVIVAGGAAMQLAAVSARPHTSDDVYRYIWDGRVQAAGIDPYRYVPTAPELTGLRDKLLWPPTTTRWCVRPGNPDPDQPGELLVPGCTKINRPKVHTIYPPVAEAYFFTIDAVSPSGRGTLPMQGGAAATAMAVTLLLLYGLGKVGRDPRLAVLWAWCPTVVLETGNGAHVDVLAVLLTVAALLLLSQARTRRGFGAGGALLGLAVATKLYPALIAPAVARRRPLTVASAAAGAAAVVYLPHVLAVGSGVLGFLPGYLQEDGYNNGRRFTLLSTVLPQSWCGPVAVAILAIAAIAVAWKADVRRPWEGALLLTGLALLLTTPGLPWYAELLVALAALSGRVEWLPVAAAAYLSVFHAEFGGTHQTAVRTGYGAAAAVIAIVALTRLALRLSAPPVLQPAAASAPQPAAAGSASQPAIPARVPALAGAAAGPVGRGSGDSPALMSGGAPAPMGDGPVADVILPCLDEAAALPYVLSRLPAGYRAIVVDNGSSDGSGEIASRLGAHVVHEPRRGFGAACHAGLLAASADVVCFCDCDGSLDLAELPLVAGPVLAGEADLVLGRRRARSLRAWPPHLRIANWLLARRIRRATGTQVRDLGPMRAAGREELLALGLRDRRFGYPLEMVLAGSRARWRIAEADVGYVPRTGQSKVTGTLAGTLRAVHDMRQVWKAVAG